MKFSELWLREWVNPKLTREALSQILTMGGFEVESLLPVAEKFSQVVIGQILTVEKHPKADRLHLCKVEIGKGDALQIVCGAPNAKAGMKVAVALVDAVLPNQMIIKETVIRGVTSHGMLCSAKELGLSDESQGIIELPTHAPLSESVWDYLKLDDYLLDISITPNRGDCLSVRGMAREIAALTDSSLKIFSLPKIKEKIKDVLSVKVEEKPACPHYVGRVIRGIKAEAETPPWLKERLCRFGIRSIHVVVDVMNYVMLEIGQPMHAFDLEKIHGSIRVRWSKKDETIALLDGTLKTLDEETLVIADDQKLLAIAGIMGGIESSVTPLTQDIFLESAYFSKETIARKTTYYNLNSDSAYRYERGVDPSLQKEALLRASELILEIAGGEAGPVIEVADKKYFPIQPAVSLTQQQVEQVLGLSIPQQKIENILDRLCFSWKKIKTGWKIQIPSYRFDVSLPEDIIEDIARLYGYDHIPTYPIKAILGVNPEKQNTKHTSLIRQILRDQGYHEIISYSFIDQKLQSLFAPHEPFYELKNPITVDMAVMRTNLWPGLMNAFLYNKNRQQRSIRLFEIGTCFTKTHQTVREESKLSGLVGGFLNQEQWGEKTREVDFYDLKGNIENIFNLLNLKNKIIFKNESHPALHPGQTAAIQYQNQNQNQKIGVMGALHPTILQALGLSSPVFVFELFLDQLVQTSLKFQDISKFPEIRRDIAILVKHAIPSQDIQDTIKKAAGAWLKDIFIFDVYQGKGISPDLKSMALALVLQHPTRTLVDQEVVELMENVVRALQGQLGVELRS